MRNFIAYTDEVREKLLEDINCSSLEDLFKQVPVKFEKFNVGDPLSELEALKRVKCLAKKNNIEYSSFVGGGVYNKFIPACVNYIAQRFEFLTAYTPYQPEISQGTLQIIYE